MVGSTHLGRGGAQVSSAGNAGGGHVVTTAIVGIVILVRGWGVARGVGTVVRTGSVPGATRPPSGRIVE